MCEGFLCIVFGKYMIQAIGNEVYKIRYYVQKPGNQWPLPMSFSSTKHHQSIPNRNHERPHRHRDANPLDPHARPSQSPPRPASSTTSASITDTDMPGTLMSFEYHHGGYMALSTCSRTGSGGHRPRRRRASRRPGIRHQELEGRWQDILRRVADTVGYGYSVSQ